MERAIQGAQELLIITGSMGSGKSTVLGAATDLLTLQGIAHAAIDLDTLGIFHLPVEIDGSSVGLRNLQLCLGKLCGSRPDPASAGQGHRDPDGSRGLPAGSGCEENRHLPLASKS
jgi:hypothetical protein